MTTLTITPDIAKKKLKLAGVVASGENVEVTVAGFGEVLTDHLQLRVMMGGVAVGVFPLEDNDAWTVSGSDLTCVLNLATEQAERFCKFGAEVCVVLEDTDTPQLYGVSNFRLLPWIKLAGVDVPVNLDNYKVKFSCLEEALRRHVENAENPHGVTKSQVGLGNVDNTSDADKPVSRAQNDAIANLRTEMTEADNTLRSRIAEKYEKPSGGIPKTDMSAAVQTSLDKADTVTLKVSKSAFDSLLGLNLADTATQKEVRVMVQTILGVLKNAAVCLALMLALPALGVDSETVWEEVEPTNKVKDVVEKFSPPADFSTNNEELVETIHAKESFTSWTNGEAVLHGPLRIRQKEDFDYVDTVISSNGVSCWRWLPYGSGGSYVNYSFNWWDLLRSESDPTVPAWAKAETKPTYTAEDVGAAPASHATNKNNPHNVTIQQIGAFSASDGSTVMGIVNTWEGYWDGTNVVFEVTNYYGNSSGELPRLRIKEFRDGAWNIVWDEITKFEVCESNILYKVSESNRVLKIELKRDFAPIAWGTVTDKGSPNVVSNSVWMTSPETYFAGGTEYQRVAVGSGTICVLVDNGAGTYTAGEEGTFRFQDEGGTNYFGFAKSDSYTIGCKTDGISVEDTLVTLRYDVIMGGSDTPIVYYRQTLSAGEWVQLNNSDGTAASGAPYTVTWYTSGGSYYAAINCGENASGFFKAETSVAGDVVFETNMKARLGGGIECLNTANGTIGVIRPTFNGSSVSWSWSTR